MANQWVFLFPICKSFLRIIDTSRKAIESCRADFSVSTNDDATYLGGGVFAPRTDVVGQFKKSYIPLRTHLDQLWVMLHLFESLQGTIPCVLSPNNPMHRTFLRRDTGTQ